MSPSDWRIVICLPLTVDDYLRHREAPDVHDFCFQTGAPATFERTFGDPARRLVAQLDKSGCNVSIRATLDDLKRAADARPRALTLVANRLNHDEIEFIDGPRTSNAVADQIPPDFDGVIDLSVCAPATLMRLLNTTHPRATLRGTPTRRAHPLAWLGFYVVLARVLIDHGPAFSDAFERTVREFA